MTPMSVIAFEPLLFGNAANNGRMLGEMDAKNPVVAMINEIAHVLTGRSEIKAKKKAGLGKLCSASSRAARSDASQWNR